VTLPPWKSARREDQEALTGFIIAELDREDEQAARDAANNSEGVRHIKLISEVAQFARRFNLIHPKPPSRPGPKPRTPIDDDFKDFDRAALDVPRIRALFLRHWGKRNRTARPMAEDIAAERWSLSADERAALINKFQRKS
jgi:hypothetical protein